MPATTPIARPSGSDTSSIPAVLDRAGAIVERYCYDSYGRLLIRESTGVGDMDDNTILTTADTSLLDAAKTGSIWDPRGDLDDDGDVDALDVRLYDSKLAIWGGTPTVTVAQAFSDVGNPFGWQARVHFAIDTAANAPDFCSRPSDPLPANQLR